MDNSSGKEIIYKEQITYLLLLTLQIAADDVKGAKDFENAFKKRLRFQKQTDWKRFRASVDLLDDTEYAIMSAFRYQLGDMKVDNRDTGELFLRLYGVLNAVYLQMYAFKEIANLLNLENSNQVELDFKRLGIYRLRNIAAAHTVDYKYDDDFRREHGINGTTSFRIVQSRLEKTGSYIQAIDENGISIEFNLLNLLTEYEAAARALLLRLIHHSVNTLVLKRNDKTEIRKRLDEMLPYLIDYSKINMNERYKAELVKNHRHLKNQNTNS